MMTRVFLTEPSAPSTQPETPSMNALRSTLAALCLSALLASPAFAQGRGFGMGMGTGLPVRLLTVEKVQKELALDDSQIEKSKTLAADVQAKGRSNFEQLQGLEGEERIKKGQEIGKQMAEENKKALSAFLKPDQIKRLRQLGLQQRGGMAFNDPEVQKELKFTGAQTEKVKSSVQDMMSQMREIFQNAGDDRAAAREKMQTLNKEFTEKMKADLTDDQKKSYKELLGAPFEFPPPMPR
jgi:hypothetical protein